MTTLGAIIVTYLYYMETETFKTNDPQMKWEIFELVLKKYLPIMYAKLPPSFIRDTVSKEPTVYKSFSKIVDQVSGNIQNDNRIITFHKLLRLAGGSSPQWPTKFILQPSEVFFNFCLPKNDTRLILIENSSYIFLNFLKKVNKTYWTYVMCRWNGHLSINQKEDELGSTYHQGAAYGCLTIDEKKAFNTTGQKTESALMVIIHEFTHFIHYGMMEDRIIAPILDFHDSTFRGILNELHEYATAPSPAGMGWKLFINKRSFDYLNGTTCPRCTLAL